MTRKVTKHLPVPASLLLSSLLCLPLDAIATGNEDRHKQHTARNTTNNNAAQADDAVQARMRNRDRLLAQRQNAPTAVPSTPGQRQKHAVNQRAEREKNRELLAMYANWLPGQHNAAQYIEDPRRSAGRQTHSLREQSTIHHVVSRLKAQLGKPYVWGGHSPASGFDCSGLVWYAFNPLLNRKLPRTANAMYQDQQLSQIHRQQLRKGDLVFFSIKTPNAADHVGVYLGDGQFIEAPRTGKNIRISELNNEFWKSKYLGARRVIKESVLL
ncbi:C40 family peptidase [Mangrovibacter yixingensis]|uniref:C40 family peptidase n=1 Tax=Mangrovibacter yixingensis TaxID=1529639 RepID=UPI001CFE534C|nr:C40 family peptidase [Mangrovibacter yixingensis]